MPNLFLKSISIGNRRNTRQYCYFLDDSLSFLLSGISMINTFVEIIVVYVVSILVFAVNDIRIHGIVCIVDTDIPGTIHVVSVEVDAEIQTRLAEGGIVTPGDVAGFLNRAIGFDDDVAFRG